VKAAECANPQVCAFDVELKALNACPQNDVLYCASVRVSQHSHLRRTAKFSSRLTLV
jgi:hypothetical protein